MADCIFCKIVEGKIPAHKIYEDTSTLAFLDAYPHAQGHTVIVPKKHAETVFDLSEGECQKLMGTVIKVMRLLKKALQAEGFNVGWNHHPVGGQVVPHLHVHVLPRYQDDGGGSIHSIIKNPGGKSVEEVAKLFK